MNHTLLLYNSLTRKKEKFKPLHEPFVGMYVCGPTVYSNSHLGHARPAVTFDLLYRWLLYRGYKVRYVRNITDVGHLENEVDEIGEDRIGKKARQEQLEPMEVVQKYMNTFHKNMADLNTLPPSIEPRASGHIIEQQELTRILLDKGFAYESNGSVYFDVETYNRKYRYGKLSGRVLEDQMSNSRALEGGDEKRSPFDFALWKKAAPEHIMRWPSEWSEGFPGWHLECSAMSTKYLGNEFDIHGGGMDLLFPHHECELAQSSAALGHDTVKYWVHNNMITINGQKMARSLGNFITLDELFSGEHKLLTSSYSPMTIRFFILQAHYRSTLDFSNEALQAAEKGLQRLIKGIKTIETIKASAKSTIDVDALAAKCHESMDDDLNSPIVLSHLFDGIRMINSAAEGKESMTADDIIRIGALYKSFVFDIMGLKDESAGEAGNDILPGIVESILTIRQELKEEKNWAMSDRIRDELLRLGIVVKDRKDGFDWEMK